MRRRISRAYEQMSADYRKRFPGNAAVVLHNIGFSMDESEVVSILLRSVDSHGTALLTLPPIELADYQNMFSLAETRVVDNCGDRR